MFTDRFEEVMAMSPAELDDLVRARHLEKRAIEADLAVAAAVAEHRLQFLDDGHRSMSGYLKAHLNCSGTEANRIRRLARVVDAVPAVGEALASGRIGVDQADTLARANAHPRAGGRFDEFAAILVGKAEELEFPEFAAAVEYFVMLADPDGAFDDRKFHEDEANATVSAGKHGVNISATGGTAIQASEMKGVFEDAVEAEFQRDCAARREMHGDDALNHPLPRSSNQRRFAAMYAIHMAAASTPPGAQAPVPVVNIAFSASLAAAVMAEHGWVADAALFGWFAREATSPSGLFDQRCHTSTGIPLQPHDALRAMLAGHVRRVVLDSAGVVVDRGRKQRLFTGEAREAAQLIAVACSHPGCGVPAELCEVDHLERWADHGASDQHNAGPACGGHNRFKERKRWRSRRAASGRVFMIKPDGTVVLAAGAREPEWAEPAPSSERTEQAAQAEHSERAGPTCPPQSAMTETGEQPSLDDLCTCPPSAGPGPEVIRRSVSWDEFGATMTGDAQPSGDTWTVYELSHADLDRRSR